MAICITHIRIGEHMQISLPIQRPNLHDALTCLHPIGAGIHPERTANGAGNAVIEMKSANTGLQRDRKSTRLNSSHVKISYAVFGLKKTKESKDLKPCTVHWRMHKRRRYTDAKPTDTANLPAWRLRPSEIVRLSQH